VKCEMHIHSGTGTSLHKDIHVPLARSWRRIKRYATTPTRRTVVLIMHEGRREGKRIMGGVVHPDEE
jgi:hypothetical protein